MREIAPGMKANLWGYNGQSPGPTIEVVEGDRVRIRRVGQGVLLEPIIQDTKEWFRKLDEFNSEPFMPEGRKQPKTPKRRIFG